MRKQLTASTNNSDEMSISDPAAHSRLRIALLTVVILTLIALCTLLVVPFLPAITWSVALAIIAWPLHRWIGRRFGRPALAAALTTTSVVLLILVPSFGLLLHLAGETTAAAEQVKSAQANGSIRSTIEQLPVLGGLTAWMNRAGVDIESEVRKAIAANTQNVSGLMQGSLAAIVQFLVTVFILYYLFLDRAEFVHGLRDLLPLSKSESVRVIGCAADSVHAGLYATLVTSLIDSVGSGLIFWMIGLPAPLLWAAVMFVLAFLPVAGAGLVWFPAVLYLGVTGRMGAAAAVLSWGILTFIFVDNILYFRLVGNRLRMHPVPALIAFLGGLAVFGISGMVLGPAIVAVAMAFRDVWHSRVGATDGAESTEKAKSRARGH